MAPQAFNGKDEGLIKWKEEVTDYCEAVHHGLKHALDYALKRKEEVIESVMRTNPLGHTAEDWSRRHVLYILPQRKTVATTDAKKIVETVLFQMVTVHGGR